MDAVKITLVGLLAFLSASAWAAPTEARSEVSSPDPESIIWKTKKPGCWRDKNCLVDNISFSEAYPTAFYKTDEFIYTAIALNVAATATITFMTAGAGAPAVVPGTSSLIVLVGGGGQGAYMAGLSTIGSLVGSNAVGGAAIINGFGALIGLPAVAKSAAFGGLALKTMTGVSLAAYDGILIGENRATEKLTFVTELRPPTKMGSKWVKELVESIYDNEEQAGEALDDDRHADFERYLAYQQADLTRGVRALECFWAPTAACQSQQLTRDDLITLAVVAYKAGQFDLFNNTVEYLRKQIKDIDGSRSFLNYLYATSLLMQSKFDGVDSVLLNAIDSEPAAIEPALLYIVFLAYTDFVKHEYAMEARVQALQEQFDDDEYDTEYSLATVYFRVGSIYAQNGRHIRALQYFEKARDRLNFTQKYPIFSGRINQQFRQDIELAMANSYFLSQQEGKAEEVFGSLCNQTTDELRKEALPKSYVGSKDCGDGDH